MVKPLFFLYTEIMYREYNPNPRGKRTGDCVVRAIAKITDQDWDQVYINICAQGYEMAEMPSTNSVWGECLRDLGFQRDTIPNTCPNCYTIKDFCRDHPRGKYAVATGTHVVAVVSGCYFDAWDSGNEVPTYFYWR